MDFQYADVAKMIDHSLLNPATTVEQLEGGIRLALAYDVASVCVLPYYLARCSEALLDSTVLPSTVVGFPHGGHTTIVKAAEARQAIADGGQELDMVVNISKVLSGDFDYVRNEIAAVVDIAHAAGRKVKVIFENCYLQDDHKRRLCEICSDLRVDWVKTSTGYGSGGATMDDLRLMRQVAAPHVQIKAAGGVRDLDTLLEVRRIGASRCGASATAKILDEARRRLQMKPVDVPADRAPAGY